jgi:hypothetical protein
MYVWLCVCHYIYIVSIPCAATLLKPSRAQGIARFIAGGGILKRDARFGADAKKPAFHG